MSLEQAKKRFTRCLDAESDNRDDMIDDLRFVSGGEEQWPVEIRKDRVGGQYKKPMLTINRTRQFVKRITGDIRQNSPQIKLHPVDDQTDEEVTEIFEGIIRHIEQASTARTAYNTAVDFQVKAGYGVWTIETDYTDDDSFEQDIFIRRKRNPFTVYIDPDAEEVTKHDMRFAFETEWLDREDLKKRYPDKNIGDFQQNQHGEGWERWYSQDKVRIARYWEKVPTTKRLGLLFDGSVVDLERNPEKEQFVRDVREVKTEKVQASIISADDILEGPFDWPGKYIPIVPLYGEEENIEGRTEYKGVVRDLQDPARMYNYWRTTAIETLALQPKAPWLVTPKEIEGLREHWKVANRADLPYLPHNPDPEMAGQRPQRQSPPQPPAAMWQEAAINQDDMKGVVGLYDPSLGAESNEVSGVAIQRRQQGSDTGNFVYVDNLSLAIEQTGRILVDLIPKIYDSERAVRVLGEDGTEAIKRINEVSPQGMLRDITKAKYDVRVSVGPSYLTKRQEASDLLVNILRYMPKIGEVAPDIIIKSFDVPGAEDVAERLKKTVPPELLDVDPESEEGQAQAQAQQLQQELQTRELQLQYAEREAKIREDEASALQKEADALKKQVETMKESQDMVNREEVLELIKEALKTSQDLPEGLLGDVVD